MKVSQSQVACFKACRRLYELKYCFNLEPIEKPEVLSRGLSYHAAVERILRHEMIDDLELEPKVKAMARVFARNFRSTVDAVECWFEYSTPSGHTVIGRMDALGTDGSVIEHKTTSGLIDGAYFQRLEMDEQIPTYMLAAHTTSVVYTVCSTPSIRQKKNETPEEFEQRCLEWFEDESSGKKFSVEVIQRTPEQLELFSAEQDSVIDIMDSAPVYYRNPAHCMKWGRLCEYAPICNTYAPGVEAIGFKQRERGYRSEDTDLI